MNQSDETSDLYERIQAGEFKVKIPVPCHPRKPAILMRRVGDLTREELLKISDVATEYANKQLEFKEAMDKYRDAEQEMMIKFRSELFKHFGVGNNKKKGLCYQKAWEHGHSSGLIDVYIYFADFVELIRD